MVLCKRLHGSVQAAAWLCASSCMVVCKRLHGSVQVVAVIRSYGWSVQAAMWWCARGYVVGGGLQHFSGGLNV